MESKEKNAQINKFAEAIVRDMFTFDKPMSIQNLKPPRTIEFLADADHTSIPTSRFEELVRAEIERDILRRAYETKKSYQLDDAMMLVFGARPEGGEGDAQ